MHVSLDYGISSDSSIAGKAMIKKCQSFDLGMTWMEKKLALLSFHSYSFWCSALYIQASEFVECTVEEFVVTPKMEWDNLDIKI